MPKKLKSKLVLCNVPSVDSPAARRFYGALLGEDFARAPNPEVESYFTLLSRDGVDLTITYRQSDEERLTCYFAVENLEESLEELRQLGGEVVVQPKDVAVDPDRAPGAGKQKSGGRPRVGRMAVLLDPDKNHVGLMEIAPDAHRHFKWGQFHEGIDDEEVKAFERAKGKSETSA